MLYLVEISCAETRDAQYVAEGIARFHFMFRSKEPLFREFARGVLGLNGMPCPAGQKMDKALLDRLKGIARGDDTQQRAPPGGQARASDKL
jgi:hypothetical protein